MAPLTKTVRSQKAPFNLCCPYYYEDGKQVGEERCLVGCVATALEVIITYYRYPPALKDTLSMKAAGYVVMPGTALDFDHILNIYKEGEYTEEEAYAVASLSYYCGVAAQMNWGLNQSGAEVYNAIGPLREAFGYASVKHLYATDYTPERWRALIDAELDNGRPVWYAGYTSLMQGHAFVIDGRDDAGFYHIHWGYGGLYDGYYDLDVLNTYEHPDFPTETGRCLGHFCNQEMLLLSPDSVSREDGDTIRQKDNLRIDSVKFMRQPDCNGYVTAHIYAHNITDVPIQAAVELFTYEKGDSAIFKNADYTALAGKNFAPRAASVMTAYARFRKSGERVFGISADGVKILFRDTVEIAPYGEKGVGIVSVDSAVTDTSASFYVKVRNKSAETWSGDMLTYSLFEGPYTTAEGDLRQWRVLNLAPGDEETDTVRFARLTAGKEYTFVVRNPWLPAYTAIFTAGEQSPAGVSSPSVSAGGQHKEGADFYTVDGKPVAAPERGGIYLKRQKEHYKKVYYQK